MPTICMFRGIKVYINWREHMPPHFHAKYSDSEVVVSINDIEVLDEAQQELFSIEPLK